MIFAKKVMFNLFIQTQKTPNPNFLKFLPITKVVMGEHEPLDILTIEQANKISPLARKFFKVEGVTQVFYGKDFISIAKEEKCNWNELKPLIFELIEHHYESNQPLIVDKTAIDDTGIQQGDSEVVKLIKELLSNRVRAVVQDDGGDVKFVSFDQQTGVLVLKMLGSCSGCPSSAATLKNGILSMMKYYIAQVKDVIEDLGPQKNQNHSHQHKHEHGHTHSHNHDHSHNHSHK